MKRLVMTKDPETEAPHVDGAGQLGAVTEGLVETLVGRAVAAQRRFEGWSEERVDGLLGGIATVVADHAHVLAAATVAETGMGNVRDKLLKNAAASVGVYAQLAGQIGCGEIGSDIERNVTEIASPMGVIV